MTAPRFQRKKEERPAQITEAAMHVFSEKGYAAARVDDVAKQAGVSKGLMYLYFKTKEDLFKSVIRSFLVSRIAKLADTADHAEGSTADFLRGPFLEFIKTLPGSRASVIVRLMVAEGYKHPDLTAFYWENVVNVAMSALQRLIERGVQSGEFRPTALDKFPQLLVAPVLFSIIWKTVFEQQNILDTDALLTAHVDVILDHLRVPADAGANS
jgi:AcrR family transcriptional regulator